MEKLNITKGRVRTFQESGIFKLRNDSDLICTMASHISLDRVSNDAEFIAESFNVANETGLTPRELLNQRNELLEALKSVLTLAKAGVNEVLTASSPEEKDGHRDGLEYLINEAQNIISKCNEK